MKKTGGEAGIRTRGRRLKPLNRLAGGCLQPLGHFSARETHYTAPDTGSKAARRRPGGPDMMALPHRHEEYWGTRVEDTAGIEPVVVAEVERETSELLSALIQIDTSNPPGNETQVAEFMRDWFRARGVEGEIAGEPKGRESLVVRLESGKPGPSLLLLAHEDVVPANAPDWQVPPFSGHIKDGYVGAAARSTSRTWWLRTPWRLRGSRPPAAPPPAPWSTPAPPTRKRAASAAPAGS